MSNNNKPTFSFGSGPPSSGATGPGPFGQASATPPAISGGFFGPASLTPTTTSGGIFGSLSSTPAPPSSGPGMFGSTLAASGGPPTPNSFGTSTASTSAQPGALLFSAAKPASSGGSSTPTQSSAPASGGFFGSVGAGGGAPGSPFGGLGSNISSAAPSGSTTPKPSGNFSGNASTTPAGPPPGGSSSAAPSGGPFSFSSVKPATEGGLFGGQASAQTSAQQTPTTTASSNLFGSSSQLVSGGLLGSPKPAEPKPTEPKPSGGTLFGAQSISQPATGHFGSLNKSQEKTAPASGATTSSALGGGLFGQTPQQNQANSAPKSGGFSASSTTDVTSKPEQAKHSPLSGLSGPPASSPAAKLTFSFPSASLATSSPVTTSAAAPATGGSLNLFGGGGTAPSSSAPTASTPGSTAPGSSLFSGLGNATTTSDSASKPTASTAVNPPSTSATATNSAPPLSFSFPSSGTTSSTATAPAAATASAENGKASTTAAGPGVSTAGPAPTPQSRLKNKSMEEIMNTWAKDLVTYQKEFQNQASKVAKWDQLLVENGDKIQKLYASTYEAERASSEVERQLSSVEGQQDELSGWLDRYEKEVDEMFSRQLGPGEGLQGPDQERDRTYKLAEKLSDRLDDMGKDLKTMIEEINNASTTLSKTSKTEDPLAQIVKILNSHLSSLQWIDQNASALQAKISAAQNQASQNMGRGANGQNALGGTGSGDGDAADEFYRSFVGSRR
ncbi:MAG: FG-nucleoporin nsp1 [Thelocarpon impressellum]|nr:MAG: FG-nucleoporin nsp1 [Thelocarpon impressellum]